MALAKGTRGTGEPTPKTKKKKQPAAIPMGVQRAEGILPYQGASAPSVPQDVHGVNRRVQTITDSFERSYGYRPSPGLVFDFLRAPVTDEEIPDLFQTPVTGARARAAFVLGQRGEALEEIYTDPQNFLRAPSLEAQKNLAEEEQELNAGRAAIEQAAAARYGSGENLLTLRRVVHAEKMSKGLPWDLYSDRIDPESPEGQALLAQEAAAGPPGLSHIHLGVTQVAESLIYAPAGFVVMGRDVGLDTRDVFSGVISRADAAVGTDPVQMKRRDITPSRSVKLASQIKKGVVEQYKNPGENPGYIFLDLLGLLSVGAGGVARVSAASRAAGRGKITALTHRPDPGYFEFRVGDDIEIVPFSDNALIRYIQLGERTLAQRRLTERHEAASWKPLNVVERQVDRFVSTEAKIGRAARARRRTERTILETDIRELRHLAGTSRRFGKAQERLPQNIRRGMTRGENAALRVLLSDEPTIPAWRAFHERMIRQAEEGRVALTADVRKAAEQIDINAHRVHLADLKMAEKALEKPSRRLQEALSLGARLSEEQELIKVLQFGLDPVRAEARIAALGAVIRGEDFVPGETVLRRKTEGAVYVPTVPRAKTKRPPKDVVPAPRPGQYGLPATPQAVKLQELDHVFTGSAIEIGDIRLDTAHLLADTAQRVFRAAAVTSEWERLLAKSVETPRSDADIPIRTKDAIPDELREKFNRVDEGTLSGKEAEALTDADLNDIWNHVLPKDDRGIEGVRWVNKYEVGDVNVRPGQPGFWAKFASSLNDPARIAILYARLGYALNMVGNAGMLMIESVFTPKYLYQAVKAHKLYGEKNMRALEALAGEGKALSFTTDDVAIPARASRKMAEAWTALTDRKMRLANMIYWAERKGYKTEDDMTRLLFSDDAKAMKDRIEISERANKGMVQFNNLSEFERNSLRHVIFVYPWVSRSIVWSLRQAFEHPVKTQALSDLGIVGEQYVEDVIGDKFPEWFRSGGYFPVFTDDSGNPMVVNPMSINTFASLNEMLELGSSPFVETPYTTPEEILGPAAEIGLRAVTGRDRFGQKYEGVPLWEAGKEFALSLPQGAAIRRGKLEIEPGTAPEDRPMFIPGLWNTYGPLLASGMTPRRLDLPALEARFYRDHPDESKRNTAEGQREEILGRLAIELRAINAFEQETEKILGRKMPAGVRRAIDLQYAFTREAAEQAMRQGHQVGDGAQMRELQIRTLAKMGRISTEEEMRLLKDLGKSILPMISGEPIQGTELGAFTKKFKDKYLNAEALTEWHEDRDFVLDVVSNAKQHIRFLRQAGLFQTSGKPSQDQLIEAGRSYLSFDKEVRQRITEGAERGEIETLRASQDRAWMDAQDKPIKIKGVTLPSPVRMNWALKDPESRTRALATMAVTGWASLSDFEKELVGKKVPPKISHGWVAYNAITDALRGNVTKEDIADADIRAAMPDPLPMGQRSVEEETRRAAAKFVDKHFAPGFYKDFLFAERPKYQRLQVLPIVSKSRYAKDWTEIFQVANQANKARTEGQKTLIDDAWDEYSRTHLLPWIEEEKPKGFKKELELLGGLDLLQTLIGD